MFTNIYEKIKNFIKENYKALLFILIIFVLFNYKLPYSIYTPGGMIDMNKRIVSDKKTESKGSINMTYVSMVKGTLPMLGLAKILPSWDIISDEDLTLEDEDINDTIKRDKYYMEEAISNATLVVFMKADIPYEIKKTDSIITYISEEAKTNLKLYDKILSYDNKNFTYFNDLKEYVSSKNIGDIINFKVERNGKVLNVKAEVIKLDNEPKIGLMTATINEYSSTPQITVKTKSSESGSSGGLMTALAIYDTITDNDLTKGRIIAGTGTIDASGNVGEIGGVIYKLAGAKKNGADVFLCPSANYEEAYNYAKKHNINIPIISLDTFDEAVSYLESGTIIGSN